jgi:hypothetical protein
MKTSFYFGGILTKLKNRRVSVYIDKERGFVLRFVKLSNEGDKEHIGRKDLTGKEYRGIGVSQGYLKNKVVLTWVKLTKEAAVVTYKQLEHFINMDDECRNLLKEWNRDREEGFERAYKKLNEGTINFHPKIKTCLEESNLPTPNPNPINLFELTEEQNQVIRDFPGARPY